MTRRKVSPIRAPAVLTEIGGIVDESSATLAVYGENLEPQDVTALLGVEPTRAFRKGDKQGPRSPAMPHGAWFLEVRGIAPAGPDTQLEILLSKLRAPGSVWRELNDRYTVQVRFAVHFEGWNKGFELNKNLTSRLADLGAGLTFDIYGYGGRDA
jgi:hypothetical protein